MEKRIATAKTRDEIRNVILAARTRREKLVQAYEEGRTPSEVVGILHEILGFETAAAIAEAVNGLAAVHDGRISPRNVAFYASIPEAWTAEELQQAGIWTVTGRIHPAHMDEIATCERLGRW